MSEILSVLSTWFQAIQTSRGQLKVRSQTKVTEEKVQVWELVKQRVQNFFEGHRAQLTINLSPRGTCL